VKPGPRCTKCVEVRKEEVDAPRSKLVAATNRLVVAKKRRALAAETHCKLVRLDQEQKKAVAEGAAAGAAGGAAVAVPIIAGAIVLGVEAAVVVPIIVGAMAVVVPSVAVAGCLQQ
jgi:VIT1/CCC1 family predicted Fe2+/Mn2+ transporter